MKNMIRILVAVFIAVTWCQVVSVFASDQGMQGNGLQAAPMVKDAAAKAPTDQVETGYWMTTSSGKRHNKNCRFYKNSKGRFCGPDEGIACKICGG